MSILLCNICCRGGYISGDCSAGYYCLAGSEDYTPNNYAPDDLNAVSCVPNDHCAGACPAGYYCPEGIDIPIPCPNHTLNEDPGARAANDCVPCPAGYYCRSGMYAYLLHREIYNTCICTFKLEPYKIQAYMYISLHVACLCTSQVIQSQSCVRSATTARKVSVRLIAQC